MLFVSYINKWMHQYLSNFKYKALFAYVNLANIQPQNSKKELEGFNLALIIFLTIKINDKYRTKPRYYLFLALLVKIDY